MLRVCRLRFRLRRVFVFRDAGQGGPDLVRGIYPTAKIVNGTGIIDVAESRIRAIYDEMLASRQFNATLVHPQQ